jgi:hypothetical protein
MELTREQKRLLKLAIAETQNVLKNGAGVDAKGTAWELWFAYDAIGNVYHQIRDKALDEKAAKETK